MLFFLLPLFPHNKGTLIFEFVFDLQTDHIVLVIVFKTLFINYF